MSAADESLFAQIAACSTPIYLSEKAQIIDYFQDRYSDEWKSELVDALSDVSDLKRSSLMRRFQGGREFSTRVTPKAREEYQQVGQSIGPVGYEPPTNGYRVTFVGEIRISKKCYERHFERYFGGADAMAFTNALMAEDEGVDDLWDLIFYAYFEDETAEGYCGEPSITVEAV